MNKRVRIGLLVLLVILQVLANRYGNQLNLQIDFLFLIILYFSLRSGYYQCIVVAALVGIVTDIYTMGILGVFGFSRVLIAFVAFHVMKFLDTKRKLFIFFLIFIHLSLSNLLANGFFQLISATGFNTRLVLVSPMVTALTGVMILSFKKIREYLNVY